MNYTVISLAVVGLALLVIQAFVTASVERGGESIAGSRAVFRVSPWVFGAVAIAAIMGGVFIFWGGEEARPAASSFVYIAGGAGFLLSSLIAGWWYAKCSVTVTAAGVTLTDPRQVRIVRFENLQGLRFSNGIIVLDEGKIPRIVIPAIYRASNDLLATIQFYHSSMGKNEPTRQP